MGRGIAQKGWALVYGGSNIGLMGELAREAHKGGAKVTGIIPKLLHGKVPALVVPHELIITDDMRYRKTEMELRAHAFVALPGGFGTLEELLEILTLKQLGHHAKPVVIVNLRSFYNPLLRVFEEMFEKKFAKPKNRELYHVSPDVKGAFEYLEGKI